MTSIAEALAETITAILIMGLPFYGSWIYHGLTGKFLAF